MHVFPEKLVVESQLLLGLGYHLPLQIEPSQLVIALALCQFGLVFYLIDIGIGSKEPVFVAVVGREGFGILWNKKD